MQDSVNKGIQRQMRLENENRVLHKWLEVKNLYPGKSTKIQE